MKNLHYKCFWKGNCSFSYISKRTNIYILNTFILKSVGNTRKSNKERKIDYIQNGKKIIKLLLFICYCILYLESLKEPKIKLIRLYRRRTNYCLHDLLVWDLEFDSQQSVTPASYHWIRLQRYSLNHHQPVQGYK